MICRMLSANFTTGSPCLPAAAVATPKNPEKKMICRRLSLDMASMMLTGTISMRICMRSTGLCAAALMALTSARLVMETPEPGLNTLAATRPSTRAKVVATSNQMKVFRLRRPSCLKSPVPAMPTTRALKISGTTIIRIIRRKMSPNTFRCTAYFGKMNPNAMPRSRATKI